MRMRCVAACSLAIIAIALLAWWSLAPSELASPQVAAFAEPVAQTRDGDRQALARLDVSAFQAQLWTPEPRPASKGTDEPASESPPPDLVLLAISREGDRRVAAIYDKRLNRVFLAEAGDAFSSVTVTAITDSAVELAWSGRTSRLQLRKDRS